MQVYSGYLSLKMVEKAITKWKILIVLLLMLFCSVAGIVFGGWYQIEKFRHHLEKIPDINQCYGAAR